MAKSTTHKHYISRLEDVIRLAKEGTRVDMEIELKKVPVIQEVRTGETDDKMQKVDTYLLIAYYDFKIDLQSYRFSKVYMFAPANESLVTMETNKEIANARLQMDYKRLSDARIHFEKKLF